MNHSGLISLRMKKHLLRSRAEGVFFVSEAK